MLDLSERELCCKSAEIRIMPLDKDGARFMKRWARKHSNKKVRSQWKNAGTALTYSVTKHC